MQKKAFSFFLILFLFCKDPLYRGCENFCNRVETCVEEKLATLPEKEKKQIHHRVYIHCMDTCIIYHKEITECKSPMQSCEEIANCLFPVLVER